MKIGKKTIVFGTLLLLCSFSIGLLAQAKPDRVTITFVYEWTSYGAPEREWMSEDGVYHTIMTPHWGVILSSDADLTGDVFYIGNLVLTDPAMWVGLGGGTFEFDGLYNGLAAGFSGRFNFKIADFQVVGKLNCHGIGAFEGMLIKGTIIGFLGAPATVEITLWN
jgi:hypothetical protein